MQINQPTFRIALLLSLMVSVTVLSTRLRADTGSCNGVPTTLPFTDVMASPFFCQIAAAYFSGLTNGTTPTITSLTMTAMLWTRSAFGTGGPSFGLMNERPSR